MAGATALSNYIKEVGIAAPIAYVGSHVQSLPYEALQKEKQFFVDELHEDLSSDTRLSNIPLAAEVMVNQVLVASIEAIDKEPEELVLIQQRLITQLRMILMGSMAQKKTNGPTA